MSKTEKQIPNRKVVFIDFLIVYIYQVNYFIIYLHLLTPFTLFFSMRSNLSRVPFGVAFPP